MSGGGTSKETTQLPAWAQPYAQAIFGQGQNVVGGTPVSGFANYNPATGQQVAPLTTAQQAGISSLTGAAGSEANLAAGGAQQLSQTLAGSYLSPESNPYLDSTYNAAAKAMTDAYRTGTAPSLMTSAQQGGVSGGTAEAEARAGDQYGLGQNLGDLATQIYGGNYQYERGLQAAAPGQVGTVQATMAAPGLQQIQAGTLTQEQQQQVLNAQQANAQQQQQFPYTQESYMANLLSTLTGGQGVTNAKQWK